MTVRGSAALLVPFILILAACTSGGGATSAPSVAATPSPAESMAPSEAPSDAASEAPPASAATGGIELTVVDGGADLGQYLVGEGDLTLYIFTNDTAGAGTSVCNGDCATNWPPLLADSAGEVAPGDGVTGEVTIITRDDGAGQVAYDGMPLYYFAGDAAPGDTNGQGLNDVWFVAEP